MHQKYSASLYDTANKEKTESDTHIACIYTSLPHFGLPPPLQQTSITILLAT